MDKRVIRNALACTSDRVVFHKDGTFTTRRDYFYGHGTTAASFSLACQAALRKRGIAVEQTAVQDRWAPWPRDSYFAATFKVVQS